MAIEIITIAILGIVAWNLKTGTERLEKKMDEIHDELKLLNNNQKES